MKIDNSDLAQLAKEKRLESAKYLMQWVIWLGLGSAGGAATVISFAARFPAPDIALQSLLPALWAFLIGVLSAGLCVPAVAARTQSEADHFAGAHNREQYNAAAKKMATFVAVPQTLADDLNRDTNAVIENAKRSHASAEAAWKRRDQWHALFLSLLIVSSLAFLVGAGWPLVALSMGRTFSPAPASADMRTLPMNGKPAASEQMPSESKK